MKLLCISAALLLTEPLVKPRPLDDLIERVPRVEICVELDLKVLPGVRLDAEALDQLRRQFEQFLAEVEKCAAERRT